MSKHYETARQIVNEWFNKPAEGEGDHSCNECELDCYLCPHLHESLVQSIAAKLQEVEDGSR